VLLEGLEVRWTCPHHHYSEGALDCAALELRLIQQGKRPFPGDLEEARRRYRAK
jgi:hypothetical protein